MRLIDADAIPWDVEGVGEIPVITKEEIDQLPTVDIPTVGESVGALPVRHGKWIDEGQYGDNFPHHAWRCSECGEHVIEIDTPWYNYCPNCGARMDDE